MFNKKNTIGYITFNGNIPSTTANSVGVIKMCSHISRLGYKTILMIPDRKLSSLANSNNVFDFYSVPQSFDICKLFNPFGLADRLSFLYSLYFYLYSICFKRVNFLITRNLEVAFWAGLFGTPVVYENHNFSKAKKHSLLRLWVKFMNNPKKPVLMAVTTKAGKLSFLSEGASEKKILVIPNATETDLFSNNLTKEDLKKKLNLDLTKLLVAYSGSFRQGKGLEYVIECAGYHKDIDFMVLGGTASEISFYKAYSEKLNIRNIMFLGHIPNASLPQYLCAADILLLPNTSNPEAHSKDYTSPMKMFDYLATGNAIVATDFPVFREILQDGRNSILVKPDSGKYLADGISKLLLNQNLFKSIGAGAKADSVKYSWHNRAKNLMNWSQAILKQD